MKGWMKQRVLFAGVLSVIALLLLAVLSGGYSIPTMNSTAARSVLVIDAGHGGMDGGAVAEDGTTEQDINLSIAYSCRDLARFLGREVVMTRTDTQSLDWNPDSTIRQNKVADIHARERITNEQNSPVFVSIHLNKFSDPSYSGAQVFWSQNHPTGQLLAEEIQRKLTEGLRPPQERSAKAADSSIYLMKHLTCPAVIAECGFLSNEQECQMLRQEDYQKKLAVCIVSGCCTVIQ